MRTAIYHGEEANIGRHGIINEGETIQFFETEVHGVAEDSRFEFLPDESQPGEIQLRATSRFDLRTINWGLPVLELDRRLVGLGLTEIHRVIEAMDSLGCIMPLKDAGPYFLSDSIMVEAARNGWTKLTPEEIVSSPGILEVVSAAEPDLTDEEITEADRAHQEYLASLNGGEGGEGEDTDEEEDDGEEHDDGETVEDAIASRNEPVDEAAHIPIETKEEVVAEKPARARRR